MGSFSPHILCNNLHKEYVKHVDKETTTIFINVTSFLAHIFCIYVDNAYLFNRIVTGLFSTGFRK